MLDKLSDYLIVPQTEPKMISTLCTRFSCYAFDYKIEMSVVCLMFFFEIVVCLI